MTIATTGRCLCGAVTYRLAKMPEGFGACHCAMCRRWTGGIELGIRAGPGDISWNGEENVRIYKSSDWAERGFCGICGTNLFWRMTAEGPMRGMTALCAGSLDSLDGLELTEEVFIDAKPSGYAFAGERRRMSEAEILAMAGADAGGNG